MWCDPGAKAPKCPSDSEPGYWVQGSHTAQKGKHPYYVQTVSSKLTLLLQYVIVIPKFSNAAKILFEVMRAFKCARVKLQLITGRQILLNSKRPTDFKHNASSDWKQE